DIDVIVIGTNFGRLASLDDMIVRDRITVSRDEKSRPLGGHETVAIVVAQTVASTGALKRESRFVVGNTNSNSDHRRLDRIHNMSEAASGSILADGLRRRLPERARRQQPHCRRKCRKTTGDGD